MKHLPLFFLVLFCLLRASAQDPVKIDSIEQKYNTLQGVQKGQALYELVTFFLRRNMTKGEHYVAEARSFIRENPNNDGLSYAFTALGLYCSRTGKLDSAVALLEQSKELAKKSQNMHALVRAHSGLSYALITVGKPQRGLENLYEALQVLDTHPDKEIEMRVRINIPWAYLELKQYRNAIRYGLQNLALTEGTSYDWIGLYNYNNIAISYGALGNTDSARYFIEKGILAAGRSKDYQMLANGYFILGNIYADAGQYDLAIKQYLKARPFREKIGNPFFIVSDLYTISELYYKSGNYKEGINAAQEALKLAEQYNLTLKFEGTYLSLAQNYEGLKDFANATKYYRLYASAKDSVYQNASAEALAEMQTRYETEKKEQQLALQNATLAHQQTHLQRTYIIIGGLVITLALVVIIFSLLRSRQRRKQIILEKEHELYVREAQIQASIQSQENERRRFAQDLHDGMGQLISALRLALHSVNRDSTLEERVAIVSKGENILNEMHQEIRSIAFNLMPQTLVQHGLVPALREMSERITGSGKIMIRVGSFDMPERLTELREISLYRIIQEWVNNVVKYAQASVIEVQLVKHEDELTVTIEDNGKGFDVETLQRGAGNGWKNIQSRLNLVKGSIDIDSRPGTTGTTLTITLPLPVVAKAKTEEVEINTQ